MVIAPEIGQVTDAEARSPTAPFNNGHSVTRIVAEKIGFVADVVSFTGFTLTVDVAPTSGAIVA